MFGSVMKCGLAIGVLIMGFDPRNAEASVYGPVPRDVLGVKAHVTPAAMCGYSCRSGGRYIPGPPSVCYDAGLRYCGSSRGDGGGAWLLLRNEGSCAVYVHRGTGRQKTLCDD